MKALLPCLRIDHSVIWMRDVWDVGYRVPPRKIRSSVRGNDSVGKKGTPGKMSFRFGRVVRLRTLEDTTRRYFISNDQFSCTVQSAL